MSSSCAWPFGSFHRTRTPQPQFFGSHVAARTSIGPLLRLLAPVDLEGDAFGRIYECFLGAFALTEGQKGGVFYTPTSIVRLIVEIIEPFHGRIFDPACGSGGMFEDIKAGKVQIVVVYKVDRLTRALADFAKIVDVLNAHDASFISVQPYGILRCEPPC